MKKIRSAVCMLLLLLPLFVGCGRTAPRPDGQNGTTAAAEAVSEAAITARDESPFSAADTTAAGSSAPAESDPRTGSPRTSATAPAQTAETTDAPTKDATMTAASTQAPTQATTATTQATTAPPAREIRTNGGDLLELSSLAHCTQSESAPVVYYTKDISSDALLRIYAALSRPLTGKIAVKLSTGESAVTNYLRPELIGPLVKSLNASIVECMTAYGGTRSAAALHKQVAADRGYTKLAAFDLMDEDGELEIPYAGARIDRAIVGSHLADYDGVLVLSHFKGHALAGFGGAVKNVGIGMSSKKGKIYVHSAGTRTAGLILNTEQRSWLEALAETTKAVSDYEGNGARMIYLSVMNRLSVSCDCEALPLEPDMHDIGVLASVDPVALDQACVDLVYAVPDGHSLIQRMESRSGAHVLEYGEQIGLGSRSYRLVDIDA